MPEPRRPHGRNGRHAPAVVGPAVTETEVQVTGRMNPNPTPPSIDIYPGDPFRDTPTAGFQDVGGELLFTVRARVTTIDNIAGQDLLLRLMDDEDDISVAGTLMEDQTLNGLASSVFVEATPATPATSTAAPNPAACSAANGGSASCGSRHEPLVRGAGARPLRTHPYLSRAAAPAPATRSPTTPPPSSSPTTPTSTPPSRSGSPPSDATTSFLAAQVQRRHPARLRPQAQPRTGRLRRPVSAPTTGSTTASCSSCRRRTRCWRSSGPRSSVRRRTAARRNPARLPRRRRHPCLPTATAGADRLPARRRRPHPQLRLLHPPQHPASQPAATLSGSTTATSTPARSSTGKAPATS